MAREYRVTPMARFFNGLMKGALRLGAGPKGSMLLTTRGRRTGRRHTIPVNVSEYEGQRYIVSPYGQRSWVHNVRASGEAELRRGRRSGRVRLEEVGASTAAPILKQHVAANPITRPYFDAQPEAPLADFEAEASRHPVFRITGPAT
jgi:deazaflavin-dependent oxidoreductase (nitroreductase family)